MRQHIKSLRRSDRFKNADSDIIVVTVGVQQKQGQTRLDTLSDNAEIMRSTMKELDRVAPNSIVLIVSNPVDVLTRIA
ncbi:lactate/malate family dehydrogenase [Nostoc sp.]|uniref:lactate/malate family dehydrogenase n=1 Tax=Nostoc sp. TaxID=1180 RepID=UPI002FF93C9F